VKSRVLFVVFGTLAFAACGGGTATVPPSSIAYDLPAASSSNPLKASVSSLSLTSTTASVPFTISEKSYAAAFTAKGCTAYVSLTPKQGKGPSQKFAAKAAKAGKCTLVIADTKKHSVSIAVTATTTTGVIQ
jgi:hypothetical protein